MTDLPSPKIFLYDLEILRCIPPKNASLDDRYDYCDGWGDHAGMGISVAAFRWGKIVEPRKVEWQEAGYVIGDTYGLSLLRKVAQTPRVIVAGFNSVAFDDRLLKANGVELTTQYDLLREVRIAAYGTASHNAMPRGHSYALGKIGEANGHPKTGTGELAPELWQGGYHKAVIDYCLNDVLTSCALLDLGLAGELVDPNTGKNLTLWPLYGGGERD